MEKQLAVLVPLTVLNDKLKQKDATHALAVVDLQSMANMLEEHRLEVTHCRKR